MKNLETRVAALERAKPIRDMRSVPDHVLEAMMLEYFGHPPTDEELETLARYGEQPDRRD
jgi:hypothetical protein